MQSKRPGGKIVPYLGSHYMLTPTRHVTVTEDEDMDVDDDDDDE